MIGDNMSYDIKWKVKIDGTDIYANVYDPEANITGNVREIITISTGLEWNNEENNGFVKDIIPQIRKGLTELEAHPKKYEKYESQNGYGTVGGVMRFFKRILSEWESVKYFHSELEDHLYFFIE